MIDLRSDTVTRPTAPMQRAMHDAELGDDVLEGDPTVRRLEAAAAERLGLEAAVYTPTATMANLLGITAHCGRGDEYLVGQQAHAYRWEGGGAAVLGSVQPQPVDNQPDGTLSLDDLEAAVKPDDPHFARTRLVCLENTWGGRVLPDGYADEVRAFADRRGLGVHLDGARFFNAVVASGRSEAETVAGADTVTLCLSKGLGAPIGALLVGDRELVERARRFRKMVGGGMRQAGVTAAAGLYALDHHVHRLAEDHANAAELASSIDHPEVRVVGAATNMVFAEVGGSGLASLTAHAAEHDVALLSGYGTMLRMVCHLDVSADDVARVAEVIGAWAG